MIRDRSRHIQARRIPRMVVILGTLLLGPGLLGHGAFSTAADPEPAQAAKKPDKWARHYAERVALFQRENAAAQGQEKNFVLVGSSHVERFNAEKLLPGQRVVNRGIASDRIGITERGILHRLDCSVFDCNPRLILIENGVNDLGELWRHGRPTIDQTERCYREVVERIRGRLPRVPMVIVGLFPTRDRYAELNPMILEFNQRLVKIAADFDCTFMDVHTPYIDTDGLLKKEYSVEGLHLTAAGYQHWAGQIADLLKRTGMME
jgi:lysophospholipase L1-like esterase